MPSPTKTPTGLAIGQSEGDKAGPDYRQMCKYGLNCYQKNPMHHQKFKHPKKSPEKTTKTSSEEDCEGCEPAAGTSVGASNEEFPEDDDVLLAATTEEKSEEAKNSDGVQTTSEPPAKRARTSDEHKEDGAKEAEKEATPEDVKQKTPEKVKRTDGKSLSISELKGLTDKERIFKVYGMEMPPDFYEFWKFVESVNGQNPLEALVPTCGLRLVGPFQVLAKDPAIFNEDNGDTVLQNDLACHHRYFYDPPEVQTVIVSTDPTSTFHLGYFRDGPKQRPAFISASGGLAKEEKITDGFSSRARIQQLGDNLFGALFNLIKKIMLDADPFKQTAIAKLKESLHVCATIKNQENDFSLEVKTSQMKARDKTKVTQTFHGAGLIVPYDKETQLGYREIPESTQSLKRILRNVVQAETEDKANSALDVLQELITNVQFANDEGDPGMGLELGINAFLMAPSEEQSKGGKGRLDSSIKHLMSVAYDLLNRDLYGRILIAHLDRRSAADAKDKFVME